MANPAELATLIRFALSQIPAHNAHHVFEEVCRHLTRQFICSNVLPATGPVSAGGDQGRDFETFRTHLREELGPGGGFLGLVSEGAIAFVCTTQADDVSAKVAADIEKVCASGHPVHEIKAFLLASMPVAARHQLESKMQKAHGVHLEVFDAEAVAELLASPQGFWIADQFLALPAAVGPPHIEDEGLAGWYVELRSRWRAKRTPEPTVGDLVSLKRGLREATFGSCARPDLPFWIALVRELLGDPRLSAPVEQRARYELVVATLRGTGDLRRTDDIARVYLDASLSETEPSRIEDASILLMYVGGAAVRGVTSITVSERRSWHAGLKERVESLLPDATPNRHASLLFILGHLGLHPAFSLETPPNAPGEVPDLAELDRDVPSIVVPAGSIELREFFADVRLSMSAWTELAEGLEQTPLFPVDRLSELLRASAPLLVDYPTWRRLVDLVDDAVARVSGKGATADRARDRAMELFRSNRLLEALEELHRAKVDWWSGDTLRGSLLAMLMIARSYLELRFPAAAKAYGLAVATSALQSADEELSDLVPRGLLIAAHADFAAGAWCGASELFEVGLVAQSQLIENGLDLEQHESVSEAVLHMTYISACAGDIDPSLHERVQASAARAGVQEIISDVLDGYGAPAADAWASFGEDELTGPAFSDVGETRRIRFSAIGTDWLVESPNDAESVRLAERFAAATQAMLAALARDDLCVLPTQITVHIESKSQDSLTSDSPLEWMPSNDGRVWKARLVPAAAPGSGDPQQIGTELLSVLTQILLDASLLPEAQFFAIMERAFQQGLDHKLSPARPYDELAAAVTPDDVYVEFGRAGFTTPWASFEGPPRAHEALSWKDGTGPTFTMERAESMLQDRYARFPSILRTTLPALRVSEQFRGTVRSLRDARWLDWHILTAVANIVMNYRFAMTGRDPEDLGAREEMARLLFEPEDERAPLVPAHIFTLDVMQQARHVAMLSLVRLWDLECHQPTPDFGGIERLLAARYGYWDHDVEHDDPFPDVD